MIFNIYCIRDNKTGFLTPTFEQNDNVSVRNFKFAINNKDTILYANAEDFDLYQIGSFDTDSGELNAVIPPKFIVAGSAVKE